MVQQAWKNRYNIFVVGGDNGYANWIPGEIVRNLEDADVVLFTGGEDVTPSFYGKLTNPKTGNNIGRDIREKEIFDRAQELGKHCLGICRGSQYLCCMSGGNLVQHQENPLCIHNMMTYDDTTIQVTSTHHQAQHPWNLPANEFKVLGWTTGISPIHEGESAADELRMPNGKECEIVFYRKTKSLGIQCHPEMMLGKEALKPSLDYIKNMFIKFMNNVYDDTRIPARINNFNNVL